MVRTGVDLIEIERVAAAIDRFGPRFLTSLRRRSFAVCANKVDSLRTLCHQGSGRQSFGRGHLAHASTGPISRCWRRGSGDRDPTARRRRSAACTSASGRSASAMPARHRLRHRRERMRNVDIAALGWEHPSGITGVIAGG